MESLARIVLIVAIGALCACLGGLWLLHTAVNDGNLWKAIVGGVLAVVGGLFVLRAAPAFLGD